MKKIENRDDLNYYYQKINELIDDYIDKNKIRPSKLEKYMKPYGEKFNKFLIRNKLSDIEGIGTILVNVIKDRVALEKDGVMQFENFNNNTYSINSFKDCLLIGMTKADINYEKIVADYFDTNLSDINIINSDRHLFEVDDWSNKKRVIIYSKEDMEIIANNIIEYLLHKRKVKLLNDLEISLIDIVDNNTFKDTVSKQVKGMVINLINKKVKGCKYLDYYKNYYLFQIYAT